MDLGRLRRIGNPRRIDRRRRPVAAAPLVRERTAAAAGDDRTHDVGIEMASRGALLLYGERDRVDVQRPIEAPPRVAADPEHDRDDQSDVDGETWPPRRA